MTVTKNANIRNVRVSINEANNDMAYTQTCPDVMFNIELQLDFGIIKSFPHRENHLKWS